MPSKSLKRYCALCRGDHSDRVVRSLCDVGFYSTAMDYRCGAVDLATVIARLRRSSPHRLNGEACQALAERLEQTSVVS